MVLAASYYGVTPYTQGGKSKKKKKVKNDWGWNNFDREEYYYNRLKTTF